jgi:hypothetical protein
MFTLLSGEHVHQGSTLSEQLDMAMTAEPRSLASVTAELPQSLIVVVDKALQYQMADRYQDATEMRNALRKVMRELSVAPVALARASRPSSQSLSDGLTVAASASNPDVPASDADTVVANAPTAQTPPRAQPPIKRTKQLILGGAAVGAIVAAVIVFAMWGRTPSSSSATGATADEPAAPAAASITSTVTPEVSAVVPASPSASALPSSAAPARRAPTSGHRKPTVPSRVEPIDGRR